MHASDQTIWRAVVDDDAMVRVGLGAVLSSAPDIEASGEAGDGAQAIDAAMRHYPDVVSGPDARHGRHGRPAGCGIR